MALTNEESRIGELGAQLAQAHYALTTDHEGPLPFRPTDADRQKLVQLLDRAPTTEEEQLFEAGYREAHGRLAGNANLGESTAGFDPVLHAEFFQLVSKYGVMVPPEGTPEREEARLLFTRTVNHLKEELGKLLPKAPPARDDEAGARAADRTRHGTRPA